MFDRSGNPKEDTQWNTSLHMARPPQSSTSLFHSSEASTWSRTSRYTGLASCPRPAKPLDWMPAITVLKFFIFEQEAPTLGMELDTSHIATYHFDLCCSNKQPNRKILHGNLRHPGSKFPSKNWSHLSLSD